MRDEVVVRKALAAEKRTFEELARGFSDMDERCLSLAWEETER